MIKLMRYFSLLFVFCLTILLIVFKDEISVYAISSEISEMRVGQIYRPEEYVTFTRATNICYYDNNYSCTGTYSSTVIFYYYDESTSYEKRETYDSVDTSQVTEVPKIYFDSQFDFWKLDRVVTGEYLTFIFVPFVFPDPIYTLECFPKVVKPGEKSSCSLKAKYDYILDSVYFKLNVENFEIFNVNSGERFNIYYNENNEYSLSYNYSFDDPDGWYETDLITFDIVSYEEKNINIQDNVNVLNLSYSDNLRMGQVDQIKATVVQEHIVTQSDDIITKSDDMIDINPKTGDVPYIVILISIIVVSLLLYLVIDREGNFQLKQ